MTVPYLVPGPKPDQPYLVVDDVTTHVVALTILSVVADHGGPLRGLTATTPAPGLTARVAGGHAVVAGPAGAYDIPVDLAAPGYDPLRHHVAVTAATAPVRQEVRLRTRPVTAAGQVRRAGLAATPLPGARVDAVVDVRVPGLTPLALRLPLRTGAPAAAPVQPVQVSAGGPLLPVTAPAAAGADVLTLGNRTGLAAGSRLRIGADPRAQYAEVATTPPDTGPGEVRLVAPLLATVPKDAQATKVTVTDDGAAGALQRAAFAGDALLALVAPLTAGTVRVAGEPYDTGAVADAGGFYRLAGLRGAPAVALLARASGLTGGQPATVVPLDPTRPVTTADLRVRP